MPPTTPACRWPRRPSWPRPAAAAGGAPLPWASRRSASRRAVINLAVKPLGHRRRPEPRGRGGSGRPSRANAVVDIVSLRALRGGLRVRDRRRPRAPAGGDPPARTRRPRRLLARAHRRPLPRRRHRRRADGNHPRPTHDARARTRPDPPPIAHTCHRQRLPPSRGASRARAPRAEHRARARATVARRRPGSRSSPQPDPGARRPDRRGAVRGHTVAPHDRAAADDRDHRAHVPSAATPAPGTMGQTRGTDGRRRERGNLADAGTTAW